MLWLRNPTNKAPVQTAVYMVQSLQGTWDHWRIIHGRECWQSVQCSYLGQVKNNTQKWQMSLLKSLWHTCTMPFYTTLFTKPQRISVNHAEISPRTCLRQPMMNQVSWKGLLKAKVWCCNSTNGYRTARMSHSAVFIFSPLPISPLFLCSKGQHGHHMPNYQIMLTKVLVYNVSLQ